MNYESERAMNQKRLRMDGEAHGVVQGNGLPLNYMGQDKSPYLYNGHQIPYQPYAGAYNTHYPPPEAFPGYAPPPGGYAPQNLSYAPPAHQNYPHHQSFAHQQQAPLHIPQTHMVHGYGGAEVHKWAPQHLPPPEPHKLEHKLPAEPEVKLEPADTRQRDLPGDMEQPKIKIKTDIFKPDDVAPHVEPEKEAAPKPVEQPRVAEILTDDTLKPEARLEDTITEKPQESCKTEESAQDTTGESVHTAEPVKTDASLPAWCKCSDGSNKTTNHSLFGPAEARSKPPSLQSTPASQEPKKRGRPKGSTNKPKPLPGSAPLLKPNTPNAPTPLRVGAPASQYTPTSRPGVGRPRGSGYQYAIRPYRKDFSGVQFRRRWSDDCLDSSHIPNEVYFGDVPVSAEVLFNYHDAGAERERLAAHAAQLAAQKAAAAKLAAAKLQARGILATEVTTVDSSSDDSSSDSDDSDSSDSDDDQPLKRTPGRPKGSTKSSTPKTPGTGRRGRPPVPPELREPGVTDIKKMCSAAGIRFDYKKLVEGCTKNKERVAKMLELLTTAGIEGKPTLEKCRAFRQAKQEAKEMERRDKQNKRKSNSVKPAETDVPRRMTRGQTGTKPRQKIVISSEEESDTPDARRTLSKLRSAVESESGED